MKTKTTLLTLVLLASVTEAGAQFYSAGTNALSLAATGINLELSMTLDRTWSLHLPLQYSPFVFDGNRRLQNLTSTPGIRYWLRESYAGGFLGLHAIASRYHVGGIWDSYRYDGRAFGGGLSFGRAYTLSTRWNFEWEAGAGLAWAAYGKYACRKCGARYGRHEGLYIIPSKVSASLIYLF
jgi:hypothetical protein